MNSWVCKMGKGEFFHELKKRQVLKKDSAACSQSVAHCSTHSLVIITCSLSLSNCNTTPAAHIEKVKDTISWFDSLYIRAVPKRRTVGCVS